MVEAVEDGEAHGLTFDRLQYLGRLDSHRRIGFLGGPEFRLLSAPDIDNAPVAVAHTTVVEFLGLVGAGKLTPVVRTGFRSRQREKSSIYPQMAPPRAPGAL